MTPQIDKQQYVTWFRDSSPYINAHRGKTFVLMLSGEALAHPNFANIVHDIALLNSLGVRLVIAYGARPQIDKQLQEQHLNTKFENNIRITDEKSLGCVKQAVGSLRADIEAQLSMGLANSPMHGARIRIYSGNLLVAKPIGVVAGVDFQHTGQVRKIAADDIRKILDDEAIVLLPPLGYSLTGESFNLSLQNVGLQTAIALQADKLIAFDECSGVLDSDGQLQRELLLAKADTTNGNNEQLMLETLQQACKSGIQRGHLISYQDDGALLQELFTRDGAGTMISLQSYEQIRTAGIDDVGGIIELIKPLEEDGTLVKRSRELLENEIDCFTVIERDGTIIACAALYPHQDGNVNSNTAEMTCVVTHQEYRRGNRASRILDSIEAQAQTQNINSLFVLTTRTAHWFIEHGFVEQDLDQLPKQKKQLYNYQRNAKIFIKHL